MGSIYITNTTHKRFSIPLRHDKTKTLIYVDIPERALNQLVSLEDSMLAQFKQVIEYHIRTKQLVEGKMASHKAANISQEVAKNEEKEKSAIISQEEDNINDTFTSKGVGMEDIEVEADNPSDEELDKKSKKRK